MAEEHDLREPFVDSAPPGDGNDRVQESIVGDAAAVVSAVVSTGSAARHYWVRRSEHHEALRVEVKEAELELERRALDAERRALYAQRYGLDALDQLDGFVIDDYRPGFNVEEDYNPGLADYDDLGW